MLYLDDENEFRRIKSLASPSIYNHNPFASCVEPMPIQLDLR